MLGPYSDYPRIKSSLKGMPGFRVEGLHLKAKRRNTEGRDLNPSSIDADPENTDTLNRHRPQPQKANLNPLQISGCLYQV